MQEGKQQASEKAGVGQIAAGGLSNLGLRLISALLLAAVTLAALYAGFPFWPLLTLVVAMGLGWEWNRMLSRSGTTAALLLLAALATVIGLAAYGLPVFGVVVAFSGTVILAAVNAGEGRLTHALGLLYFGLPTVALIWLRADEPGGTLAVLFTMLIVWVTDSAAYFTGRSLGGPKLWPAVSPNKTWSGSLGGVVAAVLAGVAFAGLAGVDHLEWIAVLSFVLSVACQAGDLMESALKRRYDRKDSSGLIPGHGGLMDRLDGLLMSVLVAALYGLWTNAEHPSAAVLPGLAP